MSENMKIECGEVLINWIWEVSESGCLTFENAADARDQHKSVGLSVNLSIKGLFTVNSP